MSHIDPKIIEEAENNLNWMISIQEKLNQFERNKVCTLIDRPNDHPIIGTKWVFRNKLDKNSVVVRNKARLVAKEYNQ